MGITDTVNDILDDVRDIWRLPDDVFNKVKGFLRQILDGVNRIDLPSMAASIIGQLKSLITEGFSGVESFVGDKIGAVQDSMSATLARIESELTGQMRYTLHTVQMLPDTFGQKVRKLTDPISSSVNNIGNSVSAGFKGVSESVENVRTSVVDSASSMEDTIKGDLTNGFNDVKASVSDGFSMISEEVKKLPGILADLIDEAKKHIVDPVVDFLKKYGIPILVGALLIIAFPALEPILSIIL